MSDYLEINRANWDERAPAHAASPGYAVQRLIDEPARLSEVVRFDRPLLGDIRGLRGVHLQCHIGTDTLSLARMGATMTGLDFSPASLAEARRIAARAGIAIDYVEAEVYSAVEALGGPGQFDLVFTGVGALCWLPDIDRWAGVVADLLRPGGRLFMREGHPVLWALADDRDDDLLVLNYPYFQQAEPLVWDDGGTYVETDREFEHTLTKEWSHGIGEIVTAILDHGLVLTTLKEHDTVPWDAIPGRMTKIADGEYQLADRPERLPHSYTLQAVKPA
jgi:SAM-dependent methyltransferase